MHHPFTQLLAAMRCILVALASAIIAPLAVIAVSFKLFLYGIALLTPADWNEKEEEILMRANYRGIPTENLRFVLWRRPSEIRRKLRELGLTQR